MERGITEYFIRNHELAVKMFYKATKEPVESES